MADRFKPPDMDWDSPGNMHKRFKIFKQKCELIFDGPLEDLAEDKKVRMLLLWVGDKGLEIYNASAWEDDRDRLKIKPVLAILEAYTKPQSNQILARYQLRCLKQGDMSLEEFVMKARLLIDDGGYILAVRESTLRDTLVFGVKSDKVRKDSIALGNTLTFKQVYDLAKIDESTKAQMEIISSGEDKPELYTLQRHTKKPVSSYSSQRFRDKQNDLSQRESTSRKPYRFQFKFKGCFRCGNNHDKSKKCPARNVNCNHCGKVGHYARVCMKQRLQKVHSIVNSPGYQGQDIYIENDEHTEGPYNVLDHNEEGTSDIEPVNVFVGTVTSTESNVPHENLHVLHDFNTHSEKIYVTVNVNDSHNMKLKVDTGADACVITTTDLQNFPFPIDILPCSNVLRSYGGSEIANLGAAMLKVSFKGESKNIKFNIVEAPGSPSMLGCRQCQELGVITANVDEVKSDRSTETPPSMNIPTAPVSMQTSQLHKSAVLKEYQDCFDRIGRFPEDRYHIQLVDNPVPVIHPPRTVIKTPSNVKELQTLLGMVTYLNRYSSQLATLTAPLRELTKKHVHFKWEPYHQQALDQIKKELCSAKILSYYDPRPTTPTILQCDASQTGIGAWIRQIDPQGNENIVAMASRSLNTTESRYSNIERECLAVMYGLEKFEYYLLGREVIVETDHSPLEQIFRKNLSLTPWHDSKECYSDACDSTFKLSISQGNLSQSLMRCHECVCRKGCTVLKAFHQKNTVSISYQPLST